jgi:hypothetical protein
MDKAIVRMAAKKYLPAEFVNKPKWGFGMYGFNHLKVDPQFFENGYIAEQLKLNRGQLDYFVQHTDPYIVAKLAGVDIFGRLYAHQEPVEAITTHNLAYLSLV